MRGETAPRIGCVLETALYVADLDRSAAFYQRVLGFPLASAPIDRMCALSVTSDQVLLLFRKGGSVQPTVRPYGTIPPTDGEGSLHVAFWIPPSEFETWHHRLRASGVGVESLVNWPEGGRSIYFRDPDGHVIELKTSNWHGAPVADEGRSDRGRPCKRAAWVAGGIGLVTVLAGTAHLVGVVATAVHQHKPFNFRLVALITIGGMLLYAGFLNLGLSRWLWRGRQWAFAMSTLATIALLGYAILLGFMKTPPDPTDPFAGASSTAGGLAIMQSICLGFLLAGWRSVRRSLPRLV